MVKDELDEKSHNKENMLNDSAYHATKIIEDKTYQME